MEPSDSCFGYAGGDSSISKRAREPTFFFPMSLHSGELWWVAMEDRLDRQGDKAALMGQDERGHGNEKGLQILADDDGDFSLLEPASLGLSPRPFERPLPCFGCGVGWFSFLLGFAFPPFWYYATVLYLGNYHLKDPRERAGLAASAIAALISTVAILISLLAVFFPRTFQRH